MDSIAIAQTKERIAEYLAHAHGINPSRPFNCLNPNHEDKHPSMSLNVKTHRVKCFSCGASYDIFDLLQIDRGISKAEAFKAAEAEFTSAARATPPPTTPAPDIIAAREKAAQIFNRAARATESHPYLRRKKLTSLRGDVRQVGNALLIPYTDTAGTIIYTETITPDGQKRKAKGTEPKDGPASMYQIHAPTPPMGEPEGDALGEPRPLWTPSRRIFVCEGFATAETLGKILTFKGEPLYFLIAAAGGKDNLDRVSRAIAKAYPDKALYIAADNDAPGIAAAQPIFNAGIAAGVLIPDREDNEEDNEEGYDWNDLYCSGEDLNSIRDDIMKQIIFFRGVKPR